MASRSAAELPRARRDWPNFVALVRRKFLSFNYNTAVDDLGRVIHPVLVEGQVHGGVVQGAGQAFGEHAIYDPATAQFLTASFMDYVMPHAGLVQKMIVDDHPVPTPGNALGAKGVRESGCSGSVPAFVNAPVDALRPLGITHLDMPFTPSRLREAIRRAAPKPETRKRPCGGLSCMAEREFATRSEMFVYDLLRTCNSAVSGRACSIALQTA